MPSHPCSGLYQLSARRRPPPSPLDAAAAERPHRLASVLAQAPPPAGPPWPAPLVTDIHVCEEATAPTAARVPPVAPSRPGPPVPFRSVPRADLPRGAGGRASLPAPLSPGANFHVATGATTGPPSVPPRARLPAVPRGLLPPRGGSCTPQPCRRPARSPMVSASGCRVGRPPTPPVLARSLVRPARPPAGIASASMPPRANRFAARPAGDDFPRPLLDSPPQAAGPMYPARRVFWFRRKAPQRRCVFAWQLQRSPAETKTARRDQTTDGPMHCVNPVAADAPSKEEPRSYRTRSTETALREPADNPPQESALTGQKPRSAPRSATRVPTVPSCLPPKRARKTDRPCEATGRSAWGQLPGKEGTPTVPDNRYNRLRRPLSTSKLSCPILEPWRR